MVFMDGENINYSPDFWPPESPDLNPVELIWHELKEFLRNEMQPQNKQQPLDNIKKFWQEKLALEMCMRYVVHVPKVSPSFA